MTYCFKCRACGARGESQAPDGYYCECGILMQRDYRSEAVGIGAGVRVSRDGTMREQAELILPSNKDFAGPGDPDGTKGMRQWHETYVPAADNPRPYSPGRIERKSF